MRVFKSDGRYRLHDQGYHYICEFMWHSEKEIYRKLHDAFTNMYGPPTFTTTNEKGFPLRKYNEHYRFEQNSSAKRRRIYMKEEHYVTMAMLTVGY